MYFLGGRGEFIWEKSNSALGFAQTAGLCSAPCQGFLLPFVVSIVSAWWEAKSTREPVSDSSSVSFPLLEDLSPLHGAETWLWEGLTLPAAFPHFSI